MVGLGVLIGRLDSVLCEYDYDEFFVRFFGSVDDLRCALRWLVRCPLSPLLEAQPLVLSATICAVEPILHLPALRCR